MKTISIIIVTYNSAATIGECLSSLQEETFTDFEVILVDNDSSDNTKQVTESIKSSASYPIKTFYSYSNLGFTGGNQLALPHAAGRYIALLNPDAMPDRQWLAELKQAMDSQVGVGICASKMIIHGTQLIDSAGDGYSTLFKGFKRGEGEDWQRFNHPEYVFGACAGAALYRRRMLEEIGFLDEDFFLIQEDTDLNFRAQLAGWKVYYVPSAIVYHKVRSSIGPMSDTAVYYTLRNTEFVKIKNVPFALLLRYLPELVLEMATEFIYFVIKHKKIRLYVQAKMNVLRFVPKMLKKRTVIMQNKKISNRHLGRIMQPMWRRDFLKSMVRKMLQG